MASCVRCRKEIGLFGNLIAYNKQTGRCGKCENEVKQKLDHWRQTFLRYCSDGLLTDQEWGSLIDQARGFELNWQETLDYVRGDAIRFLEFTLTTIASDGVITDQEESIYVSLRDRFQISRPLLESLDYRLAYLKSLSKIRMGNLPSIKPSVHLDSDEHCYMEVFATYFKINKSSVESVEGRLIATNKSLNFLSPNGGWVIPWKNIMRVLLDGTGIYLELSTKKGNGKYLVQDNQFVEAILTTATRLVKRQLLVPTDDAESRRIPQDVKTAVWQRDQGKCVQCGAISYLEFDHIIPFSKGGASSLNNIQLLCRKCNLDKHDKI